MRDKKDHATLDLPGLAPASASLLTPAQSKPASSQRLPFIEQHQFELLDATDATGLPLWRRDENTDLTGLPNWAAA